MTPRPPKRQSNDAAQQTIKSGRLSHHNSTSSVPPDDLANNSLEKPFVRAMIHRGDQAYVPPESHFPTPLPAHVPQGNRKTRPHLEQILPNQDKKERRVRLLLPRDGSIVHPGVSSSTFHPAPAIPEPNPSLWIHQYDGMMCPPEQVYAAAEYHASWFPPEERPSIVESLEQLTTARLEVWTARQRARLRLEKIEQNLLALRREMERLLLGHGSNL